MSDDVIAGDEVPVPDPGEEPDQGLHQHRVPS